MRATRFHHFVLLFQWQYPPFNIKCLLPGEVIEVRFVTTEAVEIVPEAIPLDIVYEDEAMVVVNKAAGMVVHPAPGNWNGTLLNALAHHYLVKQGGAAAVAGKVLVQDGSLRPGVVHRLDKGTSGAFSQLLAP